METELEKGIELNDTLQKDTKPKMLITGLSGLVGSYLSRLPDLKNYDVLSIDHIERSGFGNYVVADLQNLDTFSRLMNKVQPDIIINLAAMTNVDACETQREEADKVNHLVVSQISKFLDNNPNSYLLQVSTDYVFDGERGNYSESDEPNAISWYGMTKLLGEQELLKCKSSNWCIARTSTPFGIHNKKQSFPIFVIKSLRNNQEINILIDQVTSPTYADNLSNMLLEIVQKKITGIMHVSGSTQITRYDQALQIASKFNLNEKLVRPSSIKEMKWKARRPRDSSLNVAKACSILERKPIGFNEALSAFAKELAKSTII